MTCTLNKRISLIEKKISPPLKLLIVIPGKNEASCEVAKARVIQEEGITKLPDDCMVYMMNVFGKPII